jgi:integrase
VRVKLTKTRIARAGPGYTWDSEAPGLALRVRESGRRYWIFQWKGAGRRVRRATLGSVERFDLKAARRWAKGLDYEIAQGRDPQAEKARRRAAPDVGELGREFLASRRPELKPPTAEQYERCFRLHLAPHFGRRPAESLTVEDLRRLRERTPPVAFNRAVAALSAAWNWATSAGWRLPENPCRRFRRNRERPRRRYLAHAELAALGEALREEETKRPDAVALVRFLALTGLRKGEAMGLEWEDVAGRRASLRDAKSGAREVPLGAAAVAVLEAQRGRGAVRPFPIGSGGLFKCWRAVCERAKIEGATVHDLRHSAASLGISRGLPLAVVGGLLGLRRRTTSDRYAHLLEDPLQQAAEDLSAEVAAAMGGKRKR